jgi:hypothetical protein
MFLLVEAVSFGAAALLHAGLLTRAFEHHQAAVAETVIAVVLAAGLAGGLMAPRWPRAFALAAQGFALLGTFVGIVMIAIGVGPQSSLDLMLHAGFVTVLVTGLTVVARGGEAPELAR